MEGSFAYHIFTSPGEVKEEARILTAFLNAGVDHLHIRKPEWNRERIGDLVAAIPERQHRKLILHSYPDLALRFGTGFQLNRRFPDANANLRLSASCHTIHELEESGDFSFVTYSPVFDSISKPGYFPKEDTVAIDFSIFPTRVTALGGVTPEAIPYLKRHGFSGAAFLGWVWNREEGVAEMLKSLRIRNVGFQFITDGDGVRDTVSQAINVLQGGGRWIQVRMKGSDAGEVRETLQELLPHCQEYGATLIVDDLVELAGVCHGVHLGQKDTPVDEARRLLDREKIIGLTVNTPEQMRESFHSLPDYYGVGPYRFTTTKKNLAPVLGLAGIRRLAGIAKAPIVAIGGITAEDLPPIMEAGATGVAVSSIITRSADPVAMTGKFVKNEITS